MGKKVQCPGAPPTTEPNKGDTRLREAGVEAVYCLARGAPKGPNIPRAQLNHQGPLFPGHGYATHSQTWVGEPTWLGVRSDATHQAPTKVGAPCVRVWWPTWLGSVVTLLTKHLAPKVQAPPAGLGVRGDATLQTPAFTGSCATRTEGKGKMDVLRARLRQLRKHNKRLQQRLQRRRRMLTVTEIVESVHLAMQRWVLPRSQICLLRQSLQFRLLRPSLLLRVLYRGLFLDLFLELFLELSLGLPLFLGALLLFPRGISGRLYPT
ncbi:hypothetical protein ISCGN_004582 [Ixodes scapularis]